VPLHYHQATADLLRQPLVPSPAALKLLEEREAACGITLPASLREWYSLEDAVDILARHSNDDHPVPLALLGQIAPLETDPGLHVAGRLLVMRENQSVCSWVVQLDGSDGPPMLVGMDDDTAADGEPPVVWRPYAETFSTFVYNWVWDWPSGDVCSVWGSDDPLAAEDLAYLRASFPEGPPTYHWPGDCTYRFGTPAARIIIWDEPSRQADWTLISESADTLVGLLRLVWRCGNMPSTLDERGDDCGAEVLERVFRELSFGQ
jgi:hypothetical protein